MALSIVATSHSERDANAAASLTYQSNAFDIPAGGIMMIAQVKFLRGSGTNTGGLSTLTDLDGNTWTNARYVFGEIGGGTSGAIATYFRYFENARAGQRLTATRPSFSSSNMQIDTFAIAGLPADRRAAPIYVPGCGSAVLTSPSNVAYVAGRPGNTKFPMLEIATFQAYAGGGQYPKPTSFQTAGYTEVTSMRQDNTVSNIQGRVGNTGYKLHNAAFTGDIYWDNDRAAAGNGFMSEAIVIPEIISVETTAVGDIIDPYLTVAKGQGASWTRMVLPNGIKPNGALRAVSVNPRNGDIATGSETSGATPANLKIYGTLVSDNTLVLKKTFDANGLRHLKYSRDGKYLVAANSVSSHGTVQVYDVANDYALVPMTAGDLVVFAAYGAAWNAQSNKFWIADVSSSPVTIASFTIVDGKVKRGVDVGVPSNLPTNGIAVSEDGLTMFGAGGSSIAKWTISSDGQTLTQNGVAGGVVDTGNDNFAMAGNLYAMVGGVVSPYVRMLNVPAGSQRANVATPPTGRAYGVGPDPAKTGFITSTGAANGLVNRYGYGANFIGTYPTLTGGYAYGIDTADVTGVPFPNPTPAVQQPQICTVQ